LSNTSKPESEKKNKSTNKLKRKRKNDFSRTKQIAHSTILSNLIERKPKQEKEKR
jgi:hypothetical protein